MSIWDDLKRLHDNRGQLYKRDIISQLADEELLAVIHMKLLRVLYGRDLNKKIDDLQDLIVYSARLLERLKHRNALADTSIDTTDGTMLSSVWKQPKADTSGGIHLGGDHDVYR